MVAYPVLIYGGGNCELASVLQQQMQEVYRLQIKNYKVYGRTYLLANSCLAMYKRFENLKSEIDVNKKEGVYEYFSNGEDDGVERHELKMASSSDPAVFENFITCAIELFEEKEFTLILIGQSCKQGIFVDFYDAPPSYLSYEDFYSILYRVLNSYQVYVHLVIDIPLWHPIELPYHLAHNAYISTLTIWDRKKITDIFPVADWLQATAQESRTQLRQIKKRCYQVHLDCVGWKVCYKKWQLYRDAPSTLTWRAFYNLYKMLVLYPAQTAFEMKKRIQGHTEIVLQDYPELDGKEVQEYLKQVYGEYLTSEEIEGWMNEMKNCTSYYKM